eukprot:TRINITY_DN445_c0_g1_i1.p3 TRINITY_DN445_c0_g1~~TRINITY_DN445_c0_g1_i1.p3  ORF type:complete len:123 (+),score=17.06 TRINITY_DN445_c0_g1_i1:1160-1528(+)
MKAAGWHLDHQQWEGTHNYVKPRGCSPGYFAWTNGGGVGVMWTDLKGSGKVTIEFGNCWDSGNVKLYLDGALKSTQGPKKWATLVLDYKDGDKLEIKDEDGNAVVHVRSVVVACGDVNGANV